MTTADSNKALVRRFYEEIDKGNIGVLDELVADDYIDHNPPPFPGLAEGREGLKQAFSIFQHATPGYHRIEVVGKRRDGISAADRGDAAAASARVSPMRQISATEQNQTTRDENARVVDIGDGWSMELPSHGVMKNGWVNPTITSK
jgi:ketosteroid isomerase-like protein